MSSNMISFMYIALPDSYFMHSWQNPLEKHVKLAICQTDDWHKQLFILTQADTHDL